MALALELGRTRRGRLAIALFTIIAALAVLLGVWDAATARGLAPRVFGMFILGVGALSAAAAYGLRRGLVWAPWPGALCGGLTFAVGAVMLLINVREQLDYGFGSTRSWIFGSIAFVIGLFLLRIVMRPWRDLLPPAFLRPTGDPPKSALDNLRDTIGLLGVVGIAAAATAFWYSNIYVPASQLPAINTKIELATTQVGGQVQVHTTVTVKNASSFRVRTYASYFVLRLEDAGSGYDMAREACVLDASLRDSPVLDWPAWPVSLGRHGMVVNAGTLLSDKYWFEPGEEFVTGFVTPLPTNRSSPSIVRASAVLSLARGDIISESSSWQPADPSSRGDASPDSKLPCMSGHGWSHAGSVSWDIVPESLFNRITRDPVRVQTDWLLMDDGSLLANNWVVKDEAGLQGNQTVRALQLFGISETYSSEEIAVPGP